MKRQHDFQKHVLLGWRSGLFILLLAVALLTLSTRSNQMAYAQGAQVTVEVRNDPHLGVHLTGPNGLTLYTFDDDTPNTSNCRGNCVQNWPPLLIARGNPTAPPGLPGSFGVTVREDGTRQVTYNGRPLYYFRNDRARGNAGGQGVGGMWHIANVAPYVQVHSHPELGDILVGPDGMTLYTFARDGNDISACTDGCAGNWSPLVIGSRPEAGPGVRGRLTTLVRHRLDESLPHLHDALHVTYNGKPLHYWSWDEKPGDTEGHGIGDLWFVARP